MHWSKAIVAAVALLAPLSDANAMADVALAYETVEPARIRLGETALIKVTSLDGYLESIRLPSVPGLTFELAGRTQGLEFINGHSSPAWYIVIRVTPKFAGVFSIPGLTPKSSPPMLPILTPGTVRNHLRLRRRCRRHRSRKGLSSKPAARPLSN
jgi:hypothetical protein